MNMNQLIISFTVFAFLIYITTLKPRQENFYSTDNYSNPNYTTNLKYDKALYYQPTGPYYQPPQGPLPQNNCRQDPDSQVTRFDDPYAPRLAKNDSGSIKFVFCLLLIGMIYTGYINGYFAFLQNKGSSVSTSTITSSSR